MGSKLPWEDRVEEQAVRVCIGERLAGAKAKCEWPAWFCFYEVERLFRISLAGNFRCCLSDQPARTPTRPRRSLQAL